MQIKATLDNGKVTIQAIGRAEYAPGEFVSVVVEINDSTIVDSIGAALEDAASAVERQVSARLHEASLRAALSRIDRPKKE